MNVVPKEKTVTQKDVAERAGVSRGVVSYVINDGPRDVAPETRERVLAAIEELGYRPNKYAQRLKLGESSAKESLGIIAGGQSFNVLERPYYNTILAGLFDEAHRLGQEVRFFSFFDALTDPVFFNKNIHRDEISSLILILPRHDHRYPPIIRTSWTGLRSELTMSFVWKSLPRIGQRLSLIGRQRRDKPLNI